MINGLIITGVLVVSEIYFFSIYPFWEVKLPILFIVLTILYSRNSIGSLKYILLLSAGGYILDILGSTRSTQNILSLVLAGFVTYFISNKPLFANHKTRLLSVSIILYTLIYFVISKIIISSTSLFSLGITALVCPLMSLVMNWLFNLISFKKRIS